VTDGTTIRIMCPNLGCRRILSVPDSARGKLVRCRKCGMTIRIPAKGDSGTEAPAEPAA